ncbi:alkaline phosphatase PhoX [Sphingomonas tagetis]|uniref:alkaline phosphatase PhoX n=1 Tax=Sphingomonas tagetis TaxID=2949092 RepID=UPI003F5781EC
MLARHPGRGGIRRFLTGPKGCEITGITCTPDGRILFVNVQHPSDGSTWPNIDGETRPRSALIAITRADAAASEVDHQEG